MISKRMVMVAVLVLAGMAGLASAQVQCTTETFPNIVTDQNVGVVGNLNFGSNNNFVGFVQSDWFNGFGFNLWPDCADGVVWMPQVSPLASTTEPLTRQILLQDGCCTLTQLTIAAHRAEDGGEGQTGTYTIRAFDANGAQVGGTVTGQLNYNDGCVTIQTGWTACHSRIEISYSRGSELGIVDMTYCCGEEEVGGEGCTPGYWKQSQHFGNWEGYTQNQDFDSVFGVNLFNPSITLLQALQRRGGGVNRLARHGAAALLSASSSGVFYPYTVAEVIAMVQAGDADSLEDANELGCPLARAE